MTNEEILLRKIGERIKEIRTAKGLSQQELGAIIEYEKSNMSRLEAGGTNPTILTLYKVANALQTPLAELVSV